MTSRTSTVSPASSGLELRDRLQGLWLPLVTPFRDGEIDEPSLRSEEHTSELQSPC